MTLALTLALIALQLADSWTTYVALKAGARETNPIVRAVFARFGLVGQVGLALVSVALAAGVGAVCHAAGIWWPILVIAVPYAVVVWNNWRNMQP